MLNDREWSILSKEPHRLLKAYVALKDVSNGSLVDVTPRQVQLALEVSTAPGRHASQSGVPSRKVARGVIDSLIKSGLLSPTIEDGRYSLPAATHVRPSRVRLVSSMDH